MALRSVGTLAPTQLACLTNWSQILPPADLAAMAAAIASDIPFGALIMGQPRPSAVLATGTTTATITVTGITANAGSPPVSNIQIGDLVLGHAADIVPGTFVTAVLAGGTSVRLSQPTLLADLAPLAFVRKLDAPGGIGKEAQLWVPGRGTLKVLPGDIVAVDSTGWPILISANSVAYSASDWTLT